MRGKKAVFGIVMLLVVAAVYYSFSSTILVGAKSPVYTAGELREATLAYDQPEYVFVTQFYNNPEYTLPLAEMPENYQRDFVDRFGKAMSSEQQRLLLDNGVVIIPGTEYDMFSNAYARLSHDDIPVFITSDSILHLFHIEFNEMLKNLEVKELSPMLRSFLDAVITESIMQYNGLQDAGLREQARRNVAYLAVARRLLDPGYPVPSFVSAEVNEEISRIEEHEGFLRCPLFSKDCDPVCRELAFNPDDACNQALKGLNIQYEGETWDSMQLFREVCSRKCYCEDYSQYIPRGHYTASEELRRYFKAMMWLGRMTFKARGEGWTKQAVLLTDSVKDATAEYKGSQVPAYELWNSIYSVTGFFAGASDDLTFYDYDRAVNAVFGYGFNEDTTISPDIAEQLEEEIRKQRGPKILGGFEIDLVGNLKDATQGMRLLGQRYALDSQILGDLVYKNVGPNPSSRYYDEVLDYCVSGSCLGPVPVCSQPKEFYQSCENMEEDRLKYWNEVCDSAIELYCGCTGCGKDTPPANIQQVYSVCRFMPTGLDVMNALGSDEAGDLLLEYSENGYCGYDEKMDELKDIVSSYSQPNWSRNLYNAWLWMLQPVMEQKPAGYPVWMSTDVWRLKDLITSLSSWAELRHDTILYVKQSYTWAVATKGKAMPPMAAKYYGYVEPNPQLFARAKYAVDFLKQGLEEQGVLTEEVADALDRSSEMMARLRGISEIELRGEALSEDDYDYIKGIDAVFDSIIEDLASAVTVTTGLAAPGTESKTSLEGKDDAFKTSMIADVHTDANTKLVLEVGTGKVDWVVVAHKAKDGRIGIAMGPMFSYYEFGWPMSDRLTDEKWRSTVMPDMERPVWYGETGMESQSASQAYIVKKG